MDRDVPDIIWNNYLKKYRAQYKVRPDEIGIWQILCKMGNIQLYSLEKKELCFSAEWKTSRGVNSLKRRLPKFCRISQEGFCDIVVVFPEKKIDVDLFSIRKKRILTPEQRERAIATLRPHMFKETDSVDSDSYATQNANPKAEGILG